MKCLNFSPATQLNQEYLEIQRHTPAILDFIHNAMSKVLSYHITMAGITEARMLDTKIKNLRLFCQK